jgi:endonuclease/exonuclease/phosphatase family metal-dependent hydrolase
MMPGEERPDSTSQGRSPGKGRRLSFWLRPLWWANGLAALLLLVTYLAPRTDPAIAWPLALLAMSYPYQLLLHAAFILWWMLFRPRRMVLSLLLVLLGWSHVGDHFQLFGRRAPATEVRGVPVKLMSWNVRLFDLYNWNKNKASRDAIFEVLKAQDADILCLQEFFHSPDPRFFRTKESLLKDFRYKYLHDSYSQKSRYEQHFGIATFSTHPIIDRGAIAFPDNPDNQCIWSDIVIAPDTIRVYNAHLASYHFGDEEYRFLAELNTEMDGKQIQRGGKRILKLLRRGFRLRADEVKHIAEHMRESPYPVVYCGDMNDVPMSYSYRRLRLLLKDAFRESGRGTGGTYIGRLPSFRIDHILHDERIESWGFITHPEELSDHHAISCIMAVRE